jgi:hypothetical protein
MKKLKQLSVALVALSTLLIYKSARAQYMRPVPIYVPPPYLNQFDPPRNNSQPRPNSSSSVKSLRLQQMECANRVKSSFGYRNDEKFSYEDPNFSAYARRLQDECVTPFQSR